MLARATRRLLNAADYLVSSPPFRGAYMSQLLSEQFAYGHREALLRAANLPMNVVLVGYLPHGGWGDWGDFPNGPRRTPIGREVPQWMWNRTWEAKAARGGAKRAVAIGAPWLYELRNLGLSTIWNNGELGRPVDQLGTERDSRNVYFPLHAWELSSRQWDDSAHRLAAVFDPERTTVVLGWAEFLDRNVRLTYENSGFRVETAGFRSSPLYWPWSSHGDRMNFLINLARIISSADLVASDTPSTALIYGATLGKHVLVLPDLKPSFANEREVDHETRRRLLSEFDWMVNGPALGHAHLEQLDECLGYTSMRQGTELRELLEWELLPQELTMESHE